MTTPLTAPEPPAGRATPIIRGHEVRWGGRPYTAVWTAAHAQRPVRIRSRSPDTVDVYDDATGQHLEPPTPHRSAPHPATPTPPWP
ncbi:hypothetical protein ACFQ9U_29405 [Streptomyces sp. NPDC056568]|uniref:hypothetical protein n=1 Tax=unclassified Streptomyces TaxID=2593676 RepID=UPI003685826F